MITKPVVSIIIPAYNEERYLNECLSSIFKQKTDRSYEVIVVDNNSHDATCKIASQWKNVRLISELRPGAAVTRNTGAAVAQANILYFVDTDCRLPLGILNKIMMAFFENQSCQLISGPYIYDLDGFIPLFFTGTLGYFSLYHALFKLLFGISQFPGGNFAIKKDLFNAVGGFDKTINNQEIILPDDLDLAIRLYNKGINKTIFNRAYGVYSSFRRVKRSPIKHTLVRFFATLAILHKKK